MTDTTVATGLTVQQWDDQFFTESFQDNLFKPDMGKSKNSIIQVKEELTKKKGDSITFALVNRMTGAGVTGSTTLEGSEEEIDSRSHKLTVIKRRNAFRVADSDEQFSAIPLREAGKEVLMDWATENTRDRIITAFGSVNGIAYGTANETQKDAWLVDNADRCLFGALKSNNSSNDHSASLANIDNTADKLTTSAASLMKRMALTASPKIRPVRSGKTGRRYFCVYVPSLVFRDLKADPVITAAQREVGLRMQNEKLFQGGDIEWDGMIFKEIDDIAVIAGVGASGIDVAPVYFCGAQALGYGIAKRWNTVTEEFDYGDKHGVAVQEMGNIQKLTFGTGSSDTADLKDHGMVTGFFAAVADS